MDAPSRSVVERFFACMTQDKVDEAFSLVSDDVEWWVPGGLPMSGTKSKA